MPEASLHSPSLPRIPVVPFLTLLKVCNHPSCCSCSVKTQIFIFTIMKIVCSGEEWLINLYCLAGIEFLFDCSAAIWCRKIKVKDVFSGFGNSSKWRNSTEDSLSSTCCTQRWWMLQDEVTLGTKTSVHHWTSSYRDWLFTPLLGRLSEKPSDAVFIPVDGRICRDMNSGETCCCILDHLEGLIAAIEPHSVELRESRLAYLQSLEMW